MIKRFSPHNRRINHTALVFITDVKTSAFLIRYVTHARQTPRIGLVKLMFR